MKIDPEEREEVDIVDENDAVLFATTKLEAHAKGLLHRTVISEIITSNGDFILVKQAADRQDPGQYVSPVGGHVKAGESKDDALIRETEEELGFTPITYKLVGKAIFNRPVRDHIENHYFISYEIMSDSLFILNHEAVSYKTFSKDELKQLFKTHPNMFGDAYMFIVKTFYPELLS